jgi:hypothetical protein
VVVPVWRRWRKKAQQNTARACFLAQSTFYVVCNELFMLMAPELLLVAVHIAVQF